jgi:hypothetical protein
MTVLGQQRSPHLDVTVLYAGELSVDLGLARVAFCAGQLSIEEGSIGFILEVVEPGVWRCAGRGGHAGMITA